MVKEIGMFDYIFLISLQVSITEFISPFEFITVLHEKICILLLELLLII